MWYRRAQALRFEIQEYDEDHSTEISEPDTNAGGGYINAYLDDQYVGGGTFSYHSGVPILETIGVDNPLNGVGGQMVRYLLKYWNDHGMDHSEFGWNASPYARTMLQGLRNRTHQVETNVPKQHWRSEEDWLRVVPEDIDSDRLDEDLKRTPYQWYGTLFGVSTAPMQKNLFESE